MAACIKFLINYSSKSIKDFHSQMRCIYMLTFRHHLMFHKNFRCLQSCTKLPWEGHSKLKMSQDRQLLKLYLHPNFLYRMLNEEKKEKSPNDDFLKMIYKTKTDKQSQESVEMSKGEYYTQAWLSKKPDYAKLHEEESLREIDGNTSESDHISVNALPQNTFGTLTKHSTASSDYRDPNERVEEMFDEDDDEDWRKNIPLTKYGRRNRPVEFYNRHIKMFASQGKVKEAIAVFDRWMMIEDRVRPKKTTFITLMTILSKLGYTRKTFQLYRQMKNLGLDPPPLIHTLLFYSCENCPMPEYGLKRAYNLYHQLKDAGIELSLPTVKSAVRAFGRCGDFAKAFQIMDETAYPLDTEFFNALLMACISDGKAGFKRALQVWLLMAQHNIKPVDISYNLLAHCMRDSGIGDPSKFVSDLALNFGSLNQNGSNIGIVDGEKASNLFLTSTTVHALQQKLLPLNARHVGNNSKTNDGNISNAETSPAQELNSNVRTLGRNPLRGYKKEKINIKDRENEGVVNMDEDFITSVIEDNVSLSDQSNINFLACEDLQSQHSIFPDRYSGYEEKENSSSLTVMEKQLTVKLSDLNSPSGRLSLLGGMKSFLSHMKTNDVHPNAKTFTLVLACLPNNKASEMKLMELMESVGETPEIDFLNDVMMRRHRRNESRAVKDILQVISRFRLTPNMRTYAALALSCHKEQDGFSLLEDMQAANLEPTDVVMGHFMLASRLNFGYKLRLLKLMEELNLKPSECLISGLEKSIAITKQKIVQAEKKKAAEWYISHHFQQSFRKFLRFYRPWLKRTEIDSPRHPWDGLEETPGAEDNDEGKLQES